MKNRLSLLLVLCLLTVFVATGCSSPDQKTEDQQVPVETLYNKAAQYLDSGKYTEAAKAFDEVDRQYPYSQWATKAQLMSGYAYYKNLKYDDAVLALDHFIQLHPGDDNAAYALYLKALCYYEQISDVARDQKMTEQALDGLQQVAQRYPDSSYAKDALLKIDLTRDHLAGKEMAVGRYYEERKLYQSAVNRFQKVVTQYQTTTHAPEALHRLVECYLALGLKDEATKSAAILGHNHPQTSWYRDTYRLLGGKIPVLDDPAGEKKTSLFGKIFD